MHQRVGQHDGDGGDAHRSEEHPGAHRHAALDALGVLPEGLELGQLASKVAELQEKSDQGQRWHRFQLGEKRSKESKLDELLRGCRDLKSRLDKIEQRSGGDYHAYNSFEAVSRKLAEFETFREDAKRIERSMALRAWVLFGAVSIAAVAIVLANALVH